jgi:hypothetical protein
MAIDWNRPVEIDGTRYWPLTWAHNDYAYVNSWNAAKDTLIGRTLHRFFRRWQDVQFRVATGMFSRGGPVAIGWRFRFVWRTGIAQRFPHISDEV